MKIKAIDSPHFAGCHLLSVADPDAGFRMFIRRPDGTYWKVVGDVSLADHTSLGFDGEVEDEKQTEQLESAFDKWQRKEYGIET